MPPDLTTHDPVLTAIRMFPEASIMPNTGCNNCSACQLITASGLTVITFHHPDCPQRAQL